jgi:hypothetical protein
MLIIDVIDGDSTKTINIPTDWEDMTLNYWCGIYRIIEKYRKKQDFSKQIEETKEDNNGYTEPLKKATLEFLEKRDLINMNKEVFQYIAQVSDEDIEKVDMDAATKVLNAMEVFQDDYEPKNLDGFVFEGEKYYFPTDQMSGNTFQDYIEATQIEMNIENLTNGNYDVFPQQMAILCRKSGEEYDEELIEEKTEKFRTLKMDTVMEFAFFLTKQSRKLASALKMYSEEKEKVEEELKEK